jgi:hypothetical protein
MFNNLKITSFTSNGINLLDSRFVGIPQNLLYDIMNECAQRPTSRVNGPAPSEMVQIDWINLGVNRQYLEDQQ